MRVCVWVHSAPEFIRLLVSAANPVISAGEGTQWRHHPLVWIKETANILCNPNPCRCVLNSIYVSTACAPRIVSKQDRMVFSRRLAVVSMRMRPSFISFTATEQKINNKKRPNYYEYTVKIDIRQWKHTHALTQHARVSVGLVCLAIMNRNDKPKIKLDARVCVCVRVLHFWIESKFRITHETNSIRCFVARAEWKRI